MITESICFCLPMMLFLFTYDENGYVENDSVRIQLKSTDTPRYIRNGSAIALSVECTDLRTWRKELMPVILVLYDAQKEVAYWLHVQDYLKKQRFDPGTTAKTFNVHFNCTDILDVSAIKRFAQWKNELYARAWKELYGDD